MHERRQYTPATYGADYTHNLRWRYRSRYGGGSSDDPIRGGGSFGRGYGRVGPRGPAQPRPGPTLYGAEYRRYGPEYRRFVRRPRRPYRRPGTAARDYGRAYPYFGSAAAFEAAQGYPPGDTLNPDTYPRWLIPGPTYYGEEY